MTTIQDKVIVITGASSGLGAQMVQDYSAKGAIVIAIARNRSALTQLAVTCKGKIGIYPADVTSDEQIAEVMKRIYEKYSKIDVLINNAGFGKFDSFSHLSIEQFRTMMDVNFFGAVRCIHFALPFMLQNNIGHIINIASLAGKVGTAKSTAYSATKHALIGFTNSLRQELADTNIIVSSMNPGPMLTPFFDVADPTGEYVQKVGKMLLKTEKVSQEVLKMIIHKKYEVNIPRLAGIGAKLYQMFPILSERIAGRYMNRK